jgi:hypothetical protein
MKASIAGDEATSPLKSRSFPHERLVRLLQPHELVLVMAEFGEFGVDLGNGADSTGSMRFWAMASAVGLVAISGCAGRIANKPGPLAPEDSTRTNPKVIVTPENAITAKVARVNTVGQFVVLTVPVGHLPANGLHLNVYRAGLKVGEVRVTEWHMDENVVADIVAGEAQVGDDVRDK